MKRKPCFGPGIIRQTAMLFFLTGLLLQTNGQPATSEEIQKVAIHWLSEQNTSQCTVKQAQTVLFEGTDPVATVFSLEPKGFIIVSHFHSLPPVLAYSFQGVFDESHPFNTILPEDIRRRQELNENHPLYEKSLIRWKQLLKRETPVKHFSQWPPEGSTTTGGWVESQWSQSAPYNNLCPLDIINGGRSVAGCPAVALAMIMDFTKTIHFTEFTDADDYYHNYGGNKYWIDNDYITYDFPDFPELNIYLNSISEKYIYTGELLTNEEKAALVFGCGIAAKQVYGSGVSGTFGVEQAFEAYQRFGFNDAVLVFDTDTSFFTHLKQNIMNAMPVHLALLVANGQGGHNVIADGYNTNDFYHINFGWGGMYNSWYNVPEGLPYNLTRIEGAIMDIGTVQIGIHKEHAPATGALTIYPNPAQQRITVKLTEPHSENISLRFYDPTGKKHLLVVTGQMKNGEYTLQCENSLAPGLYLLVVETGEKVYSKKVLLYE
ncbi:MAG: C10 family peptidase [Bacteroidales bacterium]|nr:C10 family peptidase [Bacteroidales bacterium]